MWYHKNADIKLKPVSPTFVPNAGTRRVVSNPVPISRRRKGVSLIVKGGRKREGGREREEEKGRKRKGGREREEERERKRGRKREGGREIEEERGKKREGGKREGGREREEEKRGDEWRKGGRDSFRGRKDTIHSSFSFPK